MHERVSLFIFFSSSLVIPSSSSMGRRKKRNAHRRNNFVALHALGNSAQQDITHLIDSAKRRGSTNHQQASELQRQRAEEEAAQLVDSVQELFLSGIPSNSTCTEIVLAIVTELQRQGLEPSHRPWLRSAIKNPHVLSNCPVIRCDIKKRLSSRFGNALVTIESKHLADALVHHSKLIINRHYIRINYSKYPALPGVGGAWRSRPDPGSVRWKVQLVQFARRLDHTVFSTLWQSAPFADISEDSILEINSVTHVIAIIIGRKQHLRKAHSNLQSFTKTSDMLRIEVPFRDIQHETLAESVRGTSGNFALYFSTVRSPRLFRTDSPMLDLTALVAANSDTIWDHKYGYLEEVRWVRTVDPTSNEALARANWIRLTLSGEDFASVMAELHRRCIATSESPEMITSTIERDEKPNHLSSLFNDAKSFNIPFEIRYSVACVITSGVINPRSIGIEFWRILAEELDEDDARIVLHAMYEECSNGERYSSDIHPITLLKQCIRVCNVQTERKSGHPKEYHSDSTDDSSPEHSVTSGRGSSRARTEKPEFEKLMKRLAIRDHDWTDTSGTNSEMTNSERQRKRQKSHLTSVRRLILTPTKCVALPPEEDLLNRVLREFKKFRDRFVRVSFTDEDYSYVGHTGSADLAARIRIALRDGIQAAGESFVFLAFSNSQLRDHAVWMYNEAPTQSVHPPTADAIRKWMGTFSHIRVPAKFAARQGQAFSSTVGTVVIDEGHHTVVQDVVTSTGSYNFSDGVGTLSSKLARKVMRRLRLKHMPSVFQIRFGGAKGVLAVWDQALQRGIDVALRPSMQKFESKHRVLEIVGFSKRLPAYLNRQVITVLSTMGVPDEVFEDKLDKVMHKLNRAMKAKGTFEALDLLYTTGHHDSGVKLRASSPMMSAAKLFQAGLNCASCEHLFNMMNAFRRRMVKELTLKARIPLDSDKGVCLFGIMDELGVLKEQEVFCQFTGPRSDQTTIVTGAVLVGRSPCLHPGDIQLLEAKDHLSLRHLRDVIVFPRRGSRPIPSMLSGGDLDGDIYFCLFDDDLTDNITDGNFSAMSYKSPTPAALNRDVTTDDVASFFVDYIKNDRLGQIANAHLVHSDKDHSGIRSAACLRLAELHSVAVDFAKTGVPAEYPRSLMPRNAPGQFPDFFGRHHRVSYKSDKILGKLYRACSMGQKDERQGFRPNSKSREVDAIIDSIPVDPGILAKAEVVCEAYNIDLGRIMEEFGVLTEGEVVSGEVLSFKKRHAELRARKDYDLRIRLNRRASELRNGYRQIFHKHLGHRSDSEITEETIIMACAWHRACRKIAAADRRDGEVGKVSFPWIVGDVLLHVIRNEIGPRDMEELLSTIAAQNFSYSEVELTSPQQLSLTQI